MRLFPVLALAGCLVGPLAAQPDAFGMTEAMVPMRDGVRLHTNIFVPRKQTGPLPIIFTRTPYGIIGSPAMLWSNPNVQVLAPDGYIFVYQDIRGRFGSEGKFVMMRQPAAPGGVDETTDAWDTIDWLLKNVPGNSGKVGMFGTSYGGWLTTMALLNPHPALKAASEQASPADMYLGDDFHHNGAFRLSYGFEYSAELETSKTANTHFDFDRYDTYSWYLGLGSLTHANERWFHGSIPTWNDFVNHPNYDAFWRNQSVTAHLFKTSVPNLNVAGWWDQEDFYGPLKIYDILEKDDMQHLNFLIAGPWNHGGWNREDGTRLGPLDFGQNTSEHYHTKVLAPWFRYWLHGEGELPLREAMTFETGSNQWRQFDSWPPREARTSRLFLRAGGKLSFDAPALTPKSDYDEYVSDPANPVPYRHRPISPTYPGPGWPTWQTEDQRFVERRPDVLTWQTEPLADDVTVAGDIVAHLFASTSGSDADWVVKLIDVYPEVYKPDPKMGGYQLMIAADVLRGRFRKSFERPEPIVPGQITEYTIDLHSNNHAFLKGHRIMVQVQSTWFPLIDRNPQKFVPNIFEAKDADFQKATQRIFRGSTTPSRIDLPLLSR